MKTPAFWSDKNVVSTLLLPAAWVYDALGRLNRRAIRPIALPVPVICIGNLTAGGAGKTPVALHIGAWCRRQHIQAFFLSRGYGGSLAGPVWVDAKKHTSKEVGDEALLLAQILPTVIAKDRRAGARLALSLGAQAIIMDDGFQNPSLAKTLSLLVVDGFSLFGNNRVIPAGPLRERVGKGIKRADAVLIIHRPGHVPEALKSKPLLFASVMPNMTPGSLAGKKYVAFCGIANPQKFFGTLSKLGAELMESVSFPDHYAYQPRDMEHLVQKAKKHGVPLITTAKDAVRIPPALRPDVTVLDIRLAFEEPGMLDTLLMQALRLA